MHTQVLRTSGEQFPGNSAAAETRLSFQSETFWREFLTFSGSSKSQLLCSEKQIYACKFVVVKFEFAFEYILEIHKMTGVARL